MQMSTVAGAQVSAEKERLVESKLIAESEKRLYVKVGWVLKEKGGRLLGKSSAKMLEITLDITFA